MHNLHLISLKLFSFEVFYQATFVYLIFNELISVNIFAVKNSDEVNSGCKAASWNVNFRMNVI